MTTMQRDIRNTPLYKEIEALCSTLRRPGTGTICDATQINVSPDGRHALFAGVIMDTLEGTPPTRVCLADLDTGDTRVLTFGPHMDGAPKYSPDGRQAAFLSDRRRVGDFQLHLLDLASGAVRPTQPVAGWVEYLHWSPDGQRILLGVAGHGADVSGGQGAVTSRQEATDLPTWTPAVQSAGEAYSRRSVWVCDATTLRVYQANHDDRNIWEACWCGNDAIAVVTSPGSSEGSWYRATLQRLDLAGDTSATRPLLTPRDQLGWPAASPSGRHVAIVEACCSDRLIVAGDLKLVDTVTGAILCIDSHAVDITYSEWRSDRILLLAGHRGFESVIGRYDVLAHTFTEQWASHEMTTGGRYISVSGYGEAGDCVLIGEGFLRAPEIAMIRRGLYQPVKSFDTGYRYPRLSIERVRWPAPDGLEIQGWLLNPEGNRPMPLIMDIHGGPVWHWRPRWLGRAGTYVLTLLAHGYAVFFPNPRGSSGRGQSFARRVLGEMAGADTDDCLSGLDYLSQRGIADPARLGVTGGSYGGFMTSWLITRPHSPSPRFAAAVAMAPVSHHTTWHLLSNIPEFVSLFLGDHYRHPNGKYFLRSPITHAHQVRTPTLHICGALDRCTPPEEALQFHNALLSNGVPSTLVTYPEEGHGIRKFPALIDYEARLVSWFEQHIPQP